MTSFFKRIFAKEKPIEQVVPKPVEVPASPPPTTEPPTVPTLEPKLTTAILAEIHDEYPHLAAGCAQSVGKQRDHNEDALFTLTTTLASDSNHTPFGLYIVADGMGGHQHGEIASGVAIRAMAGYIIRKLYLPLFQVNHEEHPDESLQEMMLAAFAEANHAILKHAPGGGTTLTCALIMGTQMTITHVGDSRLYTIYPDGQIQPVTRDHSLVKRLEELGQITPEEAAQHPQRNVLYRALGQGDPLEPDINTLPLPRSSYLMLCSDGLWGVITEKQIFEIVNTAPSLQEACQKLVETANDAGGPDNISVILVRIPD